MQHLVFGLDASGPGDVAVVPAVDPPPHLDISPVPGRPCSMRLARELDACCAHLVPAALEQLSASCGTIELDLTRLEFIDVAGARSLVTAAHAMGESTSASIVVTGVNPSVRDVLALFLGDDLAVTRIELL